MGLSGQWSCCYPENAPKKINKNNDLIFRWGTMKQLSIPWVEEFNWVEALLNLDHWQCCGFAKLCFHFLIKFSHQLRLQLWTQLNGSMIDCVNNLQNYVECKTSWQSAFIIHSALFAPSRLRSWANNLKLDLIENDNRTCINHNPTSQTLAHCLKFEANLLPVVVVV